MADNQNCSSPLPETASVKLRSVVEALRLHQVQDDIGYSVLIQSPLCKDPLYRCRMYCILRRADQIGLIHAAQKR